MLLYEKMSTLSPRAESNVLFNMEISAESGVGTAYIYSEMYLQ